MSRAVLVVEDDDQLRAALCDTLRLAGFRVLEAIDGGQALELIASEAVGLVVSDVQMAPVDGMQLMTEIKRRNWSRFRLRTLFVMLTLVCIVLAWQLSLVHSRRQLIREMRYNSAFTIVTADNIFTVGVRQSGHKQQAEM